MKIFYDIKYSRFLNKQEETSQKDQGLERGTSCSNVISTYPNSGETTLTSISEEAGGLSGSATENPTGEESFQVILNS